MCAIKAVDGSRYQEQHLLKTKPGRFYLSGSRFYEKAKNEPESGKFTCGFNETVVIVQ